MAEISGDHTAEQAHFEAFRRENADLGIRRPAHMLNATPLDQLASPSSSGRPAYRSKAAMVRRSLVTLTTRRSSFDIWAALACLEDLLSDYRRIAPRFFFMQTAGEAGVAVGNEYRLTLSDPALLEPINAAFHDKRPDDTSPPPITQRVMDIRVVRAGPWGGETGELVVEALQNHALAGASSLWILAHGESDEGDMRVTLDAFDVARWAWTPDYVANQQNTGTSSGARIIDWDYLFERLAQTLDGSPEATEPRTSFSFTGDPNVIHQDDRVRESLAIHGGLKPFFDQFSPNT